MSDEPHPFLTSEPDPLGLMDIIELIAPDAQVTGWERLAGGLGAATHRIRVDMPSGARTAFVLRRYNPEWNDAADVIREAETLEKLRPTHVDAPEMLWLDADGHAFGAPALAMTLLPGRTSLATHEPVRWAQDLAEPLASVHLIPPSMVDHLPVRATPRDELARIADHATTARDSDHLDAARIWDVLEQHADELSTGDRRLCHGDFHGGQVLRDDDGAVTGIIDWDHAYVGDPRADVAYAAYDTTLVHGPDAAEGFVERYVQLSGRALDDWWWWRLLAVAASLPDPAAWGAGMRELGADVTSQQLRDRARAYAERCLADAPQ